MVPVTIVTGFLGSGKSSLIAHTLDNADGQLLGIVINELAMESIDSVRIAGGERPSALAGDLVRVITGGRAGGDRLDACIGAIGDLARSDPAPEAIMVEVDGTSPVSTLVAALEAADSPATLDTVICVVDTGSFPAIWALAQARGVVRDQLANADLVILNKYDSASAWQRWRVRRLAARLAGRAQIASTDYARVPLSEAVRTGHRAEMRPNDGAKGAGEGSLDTAAFVARHVRERAPIHPRRLHEFLDAEWPEVLRVKGYLWIATDMDHVYALDADIGSREIGLDGRWEAADGEPADARSRHAYGDRRQELTLLGTPQAVERFAYEFRSILLSSSEADRGPQAWRTLDDPVTPALLSQLNEPYDDQQG